MTQPTSRRLQSVIFILLSITSLSSCLNDDAPRDITRTIDITVLSETEVSFPLMDDKHQTPVEMLVITDGKGNRSHVYPAEIKGFDWERGYTYHLSVDQTTLANPPMDASNVTYTLRKIISRQKDLTFLPSDIAVTTEADVTYAPDTPAEIYLPDRDSFTIDDSGNISAINHNTCTQDVFIGYLSFIYTLSPSSPLYCRWNYLAEKIYVSSPFSPRMRQLNYGIIALEDIISPVEQSRMINEATGTTFHYTLYFYNAENLAIQKLPITIIRI